MKFLCVGSGNSGVFFHSDFKPGTADVSQGLQFEVDCNIGQHTGGMYGDGRQWIVWPAPENETVVRKNEWNEYLLKVEGNRYISRLNGVHDGRFHRPAAEVVRRRHLAATALRRRRAHAVQGHLGQGLVETLRLRSRTSYG